MKHVKLGVDSTTEGLMRDHTLNALTNWPKTNKHDEQMKRIPPRLISMFDSINVDN